jgi:hypothetical protein
MEVSIAVAAAVAGVFVTLVAMAVGWWAVKATVSLIRKLVMFSFVLAIGVGVVGATVLAALFATH